MNASDWEHLFRASRQDLWLQINEATRVREARFARRVSLCVIINAKSGLCSEDCAFCSQAATSKTEIAKYPLLTKEKLVDAAQAAAGQDSRVGGGHQ